MQFRAKSIKFSRHDLTPRYQPGMLWYNRAMTTTLDYAGPDAIRPMRGLLRAAVILAGLPLVAGVAILLTYLATEWEPLVAMGMLTLWGGPVALLVSAGLLIAYGLHSWKNRCVKWRELVRQIGLTVLLMAANFPAALGCIWAGTYYTITAIVPVVVQNQGTAVAQVTLDGPGGNWKFALGPGQSWKTQLKVHIGTGTLTYKTVIGTVVQEGEARSWTDPDAMRSGGVSIITITVKDAGTSVQ